MHLRAYGGLSISGATEHKPEKEGSQLDSFPPNKVHEVWAERATGKKLYRVSIRVKSSVDVFCRKKGS